MTSAKSIDGVLGVLFTLVLRDSGDVDPARGIENSGP